MSTKKKSKERELEINESVIRSEETYKLLILSLILSLLSTLLAIYVTVRSRQESDASSKDSEKTIKCMKKELLELHEEIALCKRNP